jgi:hypothetical protein
MLSPFEISANFVPAQPARPVQSARAGLSSPFEVSSSDVPPHAQDAPSLAEHVRVAWCLVRLSMVSFCMRGFSVRDKGVNPEAGREWTAFRHHANNTS